jgi:hypothetical protein
VTGFGRLQGVEQEFVHGVRPGRYRSMPAMFCQGCWPEKVATPPAITSDEVSRREGLMAKQAPNESIPRSEHLGSHWPEQKIS